MKRFLLLLIIILVFTTIGCAQRNMKMEDFPELPLMGNMELEKNKDSDFVGYPEGVSTYVIEGQDMSSFLDEYEETLNTEGWTVIERRNNSAIDVKKNGYEASVIVYRSEGKLKADIKKQEE